MWVIIVVVVLIVLLVLFAIIGFNKLRKLSVNASEGWAQIEVQLTRRSDLIPNLVETVKGYASHEKSVLEAVTAARAQTIEAKSVHEAAAADQSMTKALANVNAVAENYPDLKASTNFLHLQEELSTTENKIAFSRQYYNDTVSALNTALITIPWMFFKGLTGVTKREFYEVPEGTSRNAADVRFN